MYTHKEGYLCDSNKKLMHRKIMEEYLGRKLLPTELIHHINGDKKDNRIENLEITTQAKHNTLHHLGCEHITLLCAACGKEFERPKRYFNHKLKYGQTYFVCSRKCNGKLNQQNLQHEKSKYEDIILAELKQGLTGYAIAKKHKLNRKTIYHYIKNNLPDKLILSRKKPLIDSKYRCSKCKELKYPEEFNKKKSTATGYAPQCKKCVSGV